MEKAEAAHIAYAAVLVSPVYVVSYHNHLAFGLQARFEISSHTRWAEKDAHFNYCNFYYIVMDLINECKDVKWRETLLKHYNMYVTFLSYLCPNFLSGFSSRMKKVVAMTP